jgi:hypothetical protein
LFHSISQQIERSPINRSPPALALLQPPLLSTTGRKPRRRPSTRDHRELLSDVHPFTNSERHDIVADDLTRAADPSPVTGTLAPTGELLSSLIVAVRSRSSGSDRSTYRIGTVQLDPYDLI